MDTQVTENLVENLCKVATQISRSDKDNTACTFTGCNPLTIYATGIRRMNKVVELYIEFWLHGDEPIPAYTLTIEEGDILDEDVCRDFLRSHFDCEDNWYANEYIAMLKQGEDDSAYEHSCHSLGIRNLLTQLQLVHSKSDTVRTLQNILPSKDSVITILSQGKLKGRIIPVVMKHTVETVESGLNIDTQLRLAREPLDYSLRSANLLHTVISLAHP